MAPHVALIPFPFASHPGALFSLARAFAAAAPEATFTFLSTERSLAPLAAAAATPNNVRLLAIADGCPSPVPTDVGVQIGMFLRAAPGNIRAGVEAAGTAIGVAVSCIVSDALIWTAREVADGMGVPWVALWTAQSDSLSTHIHTDLIRKTIGLGGEATSNRTQVTLNFIPGLSTVQVQDLPKDILTDDINSSNGEGDSGKLSQFGFKGRVVTKETVLSSLKLVLKEEEGKKMKERICKLKAMANEAVGLEGTSTKNLFKLLEIIHKG